MNYKLFRWSVLIVLLVGLVSSCREDIITETIIDINDQDIVRLESNVFGMVSDATGDPLSTLVSVRGESVSSDNAGIFDFNQIGLNSKGEIVKIEKYGYTPFYKWVFPSLGHTQFLNITLGSKPIVSSTIDPSEHSDNYLNYKYDQRTFLRDGEFYLGELTFEIDKILSPKLESQNSTPIPDFMVRDGEFLHLELMELIHLKIRGDQNDILDIAQNHGPVLSLSISPQLFNFEELSIYHWDELRNTWVKTGNLHGSWNSAVFTVEDMGWWCIAREKATVQQEISVSLNNQLISYGHLLIHNENDNKVIEAYTNSVGVAHVLVDPGTQYHISVIDQCGEKLVETSMVTNGDSWEINLDNSVTSWTTEVFNCDNEPYLKSMLILELDGKNFPLKPDAYGNLLIYLPKCMNGNFISFYEKKSRTKFWLSRELVKGGNQDSLWLCEDSPIGGVVTRGNKSIGIDSSLVCRIDTSNFRIELSYTLFNETERFIIEDISATSVIGFASGNILNSDIENHPMTFNIHQIGEVGGLFIANFKGEVRIGSNSTLYPVEGNVVARVIEFK